MILSTLFTRATVLNNKIICFLVENEGDMLQGKNISKIGLGCVTFGREIDERSSFAMMDYASNKGINFFDTAAAYGNGTSESILGKWLKMDRNSESSIMVATKILPSFDAENIKKLVDESLQRLKIESIDLLYLHRWDITLEAGSLKALNDLVICGKIRALGASNFTTEQLSTTLFKQAENNFTPFQYVQNNNNLAVSDIGFGFKRICQQYNINIVTYSPLGAGFLTGKHQSGVEPGTRFDVIPGHRDVYFNEGSYRRLKKPQEIAERTGHTSSHLALAWALHQPGITSVLIGGRTTAHIDQAIAALDYNDLAVFSALEET